MDIQHGLDRAFELAALGPAHGPNPRVGCVIVSASGQILGEGYHQGSGSDHAEVAALADLRQRGNNSQGATAIVTLEPCLHQGASPPCAPVLGQAGIKRVVAAMADPNPVAAGGAAYLRAQGVRVDLDVAAERAKEQNLAWWHSVTCQRPYVSLKLASSLDGRIAAADGSSRWITGLAARLHAHQIRAQIDAIVVGLGTILADNPALTARLADGSLDAWQPRRIAVGLRPIPPEAAIFGPGGPTDQITNHDPNQVLAFLHKHQVRHVLVEGGATIAAAWLAAGLVDQIWAYLAPVVLGAGLPAVGDIGVTTLDQAERFTTRQITPLGQDVLIEARKVKNDQDVYRTG